MCACRDRKVFSIIKAQLGLDRVRIMVTGSAPIASHVLDLLRAVFGWVFLCVAHPPCLPANLYYLSVLSVALVWSSVAPRCCFSLVVLPCRRPAVPFSPPHPHLHPPPQQPLYHLSSPRVFQTTVHRFIILLLCALVATPSLPPSLSPHFSVSPQLLCSGGLWPDRVHSGCYTVRHQRREELWARRWAPALQ